MNTRIGATPGNRQQGAVLIMVALSIIVLVGMIGLVVDLAHLMVTKTELQNAADACALAAARELTGDTNALVRAENAGIAVATRNRVNFQAAAVTVLPDDITFSANLSPNASYLSRLAGADPVTAKFAMCTLPQAGIAMWFMQALGFGPQTVNAMGAATLAPSQTNCAVPLGICSKGPAPGYGLNSGDWISGRFGSGDGVNGAFNWLHFPGQANGAPGVINGLTGSGNCDLARNETIPAETGNLGAAGAKAWNSRFGLYQGGGGNPNLTTAPPDFTGYGYTATSWSPGRNALPDFLSKRATNAPYEGDALTGLSLPGGTTSLTAAQLAASGADRRLVTAPIVDCTTWGPSHIANMMDFACVLMLHPIGSPTDTVYMEYRGLSSDPGSPCATSGLAGGTAGPLVPVLVQ